MKNLMKRFALALTLLFTCQQVLAQNGSIGSPFTHLDQAANVTTGGMYFFDFGGVTFYTFVDSSGYVRVALDHGGGAGNLPAYNNLDLVDRGILNPTVLASLTDIQEVRISSSSGGTDVISTHDSIAWRIQNNMALHRGWIDTTINQSWSGLNDTAFTTIPSVNCGPFSNSALHERIIHNCGAYYSFTWCPVYSNQREVWDNGEVPSSVFFSLWVKGNACPAPVYSTDMISACDPITWIDGNTYTTSNNTATHTLSTTDGCDSIVTLDFTLTTIDPTVTQTGFDLAANMTGATYQWVDCDDNYSHVSGATNQTYSADQNGNYAVIVSTGGCSDTSTCYLVEGLDISTNFEVLADVYPNPATNFLNVDAGSIALNIELTDVTGQVVLSTKVDALTKSQLNINHLPAGIYFITLYNYEADYLRQIKIQKR